MPDDQHEDDNFDPLDLTLEARGRKKSLGRLGALIARCIKLVWRSGRFLFLSMVTLQILTALALAGQVLAVESLLQAILSLTAGAHLGAQVLEPVAVLAILMAVGSLSGAVQDYVRRYLGESVARTMWQQVLDVATRVTLRLFESPNFYDRLQRVQASAVTRPFQVTQALIGIVGSLTAAISVGATLVALYPLLLPLLLLGGVPLIVTSRRESRLEFEFTVKQTSALRIRSYLTFVLTGRAEAKEIRAFDIGPVLRSRFDALYGSYQADLRHHLMRRSRLSLLGNLLSAIVLACTLFALMLLIANGRISVAQAGAAIVAIRMLQGQIQGLLSGAQTIFESGLFLDDVNRFIALGPAADTEAAGEPAPQSFQQIRIHDLRFTYPGSDREALQGLDLRISRGEVIALVGENGSGKTTLAKIIAGLYDASSGTIKWDDTDTRTMSRSSLRSHVAVIFQDFVRYAFTAEDNISVGRLSEEKDLAEVRKAANRAGADGFLSALPRGYSTILSRMFKSGRDLSGGQWQRVAIARAFYRNAPLIILDEPTAALDPRAEHDLFESLRTVLSGRTAVFVSHRFSSVRSADRIYVLHEGRVVEHGTHEELMGIDGHYAELFRLQAAAYLDPDGKSPHPDV